MIFDALTYSTIAIVLAVAYVVIRLAISKKNS
jgi:hypothetical protein